MSFYNKTEKLARILLSSIEDEETTHHPEKRNTDRPGGLFQPIGEKGETFWAGEGGGASGILPFCQTTQRICLAWRSRAVHMGHCWGTIGGAISRGLLPQESALKEMREETGYQGLIQLQNAYVFSSGKFKYYNFLGIVDKEFPFVPLGGASWETDYIKWFDYKHALQEIETGRAHPGLKALFANSRNLIEKLIHESS